MLSKDTLEALTPAGEPPYLSIFLPTTRTSGADGPDRIRLKNLLRESQQGLEESGLDSTSAARLLAPVEQLMEDESFWGQQLEGLALFVSTGGLRYHRLPVRVPEEVFVGTHFRLLPFLPLLTRDGLFYILALSQKQVRLLKATRSGASEIPLPGVPGSLEEALKFDDPQTQLQYHTGASGTKGERAAMFHGHGVGVDDSKDRIARFCRLVDRGLQPFLSDRTAPLVVACVKYLLPIYRQANSHPGLCEEGIPGNPERLSEAELHGRGWPIALSHFESVQSNVLQQFDSLVGSGKTSTRIEEIVAAAHSGAIQTLLLAEGACQWGRFDPETQELVCHEKSHPRDEELLELTVMQALSQGGDVFVMAPERMPQAGPMAAIFRYPARV